MNNELIDNEYKYYAFISYKHEDKYWANKLYHDIQSYHLPVEKSKDYKNGKITPIFIDHQEHLVATYEEAILQNCKLSKYLIVVCSRATKNEPDYINGEIKEFLSANSKNCKRVIPFIVDDCESPEKNCFPDELENLGVIAANINDSGKKVLGNNKEGYRRAFLSLMASMLDLKPTDLESFDEKQRKQRHKRRRNIIIASILLVFLCLKFLYHVYKPLPNVSIDYRLKGEEKWEELDKPESIDVGDILTFRVDVSNVNKRTEPVRVELDRNLALKSGTVYLYDEKSDRVPADDNLVDNGIDLKQYINNRNFLTYHTEYIVFDTEIINQDIGITGKELSAKVIAGEQGNIMEDDCTVIIRRDDPKISISARSDSNKEWVDNTISVYDDEEDIDFKVNLKNFESWKYRQMDMRFECEYGLDVDGVGITLNKESAPEEDVIAGAFLNGIDLKQYELTGDDSLFFHATINDWKQSMDWFDVSEITLKAICCIDEQIFESSFRICYYPWDKSTDFEPEAGYLANFVGKDKRSVRNSTSIINANRGVVLNTLENSIIGDERYFISAKESRYDDTESKRNEILAWGSNKVDVQRPGIYDVLLYVHNDNPDGYNSVAEDVMANFYIPDYIGEELEIGGQIYSSNSEYSRYESNVVFRSDKKMRMKYVRGSARLYNRGIGKNGGYILTDGSDTVFPKAGASINTDRYGNNFHHIPINIGFNALDGRLPGGEDFGCYIVIQVELGYVRNIDKPTVTVKLRKPGEAAWHNSLEAEVGDEIEFVIKYQNVYDVHQEKIATRLILPTNMELIGDVILYNEQNPKPDGLVLKGNIFKCIYIGGYYPEATAYISFKAKVVDNSLIIGKNKLRTWAQIGIGAYTVQDSVDVIIQKE